MQACKHYIKEGLLVTENPKVTSDFQLYLKSRAFFVRHSQGFNKQLQLQFQLHLSAIFLKIKNHNKTAIAMCSLHSL